MNKKYAHFLLNKNKNCYNASAEKFSGRRQDVWNEMEFLFRDFLKKDDKTLDLGCGNGRFFELIKKLGADYTGIDNSKKLIEIAKRKYPETNFLIGDALNLPFPKNHFDKICAIALLHHIPSKELRKQALAEVWRVLKKDGIFILTVWNLWKNPRAKKLIFKFAFLKIFGGVKLDFKDILMLWHGADDCYFHFFTARELRKLTNAAGFNIIKSGEIKVGNNSNLYLVCGK